MAGKQVLFRTNNQAVGLVFCRDPPLMHLLRSPFFIEANFDFEHKMVHISGKENGIADALSRNDNYVYFLLFVTTGRSSPFCHPTVTNRTAVRSVSTADISTLERFAQEFFA